MATFAPLESDFAAGILKGKHGFHLLAAAISHVSSSKCATACTFATPTNSAPPFVGFQIIHMCMICEFHPPPAPGGEDAEFHTCVGFDCLLNLLDARGLSDFEVNLSHVTTFEAAEVPAAPGKYSTNYNHGNNFDQKTLANSKHVLNLELMGWMA